MKTINQIAIELLKFNKILIFCHIRPDGDTLGCAGALKLAFAKKGIKSDIVCDGAVPTKYSFLPVLRGVLAPSEVKEKYQAHLAVDVATELLLGLSWGIFIGNDNRYVIDHHSSNSRYVKDCYISCAPAACIPVFDLICQMGVEIDSDIANCILLGIVTDTGNFSHNNADKIAFGYASKALEYGADLNLITLNLYKSQSKQRVKLYLDVMNGMRFYEDDKIAIITVFKKQLEDLELTSDVTEDFVDYPLSVAGVEVAVSLLQTKEELFKVSFRSKGMADVNLIAEEFGGGGHKLASGCVVAGIYEEVIEKIIRAITINI